MSWVPPLEEPKPVYLGWEIESDQENEFEDWEYLGTTTESEAPVFYEPQTGNVYRARVEHESERIVSESEPSWEVKAEETIGEFLERVGKDIGWETLSEYARENLEHEGNQ